MFPNPNSNSTISTSTTGIYNAFSTAGYAPASIVSCANGGPIITGSGALTAGVLAPLYTFNNTRSKISHLTIRAVDATVRTLRVKITNENGVIYDFTSAALTTNQGCCLAGQARNDAFIIFPPIESLVNCKIEIASSVTETGKFTIEIAYQTMRL